MAQANPTKGTLDAKEHEDDLEAQRKKRAESAIEKSSTTHGGDKMEQVPIEDEYSVQEGKSKEDE